MLIEGRSARPYLAEFANSAQLPAKQAESLVSAFNSALIAMPPELLYHRQPAELPAIYAQFDSGARSAFHRAALAQLIEQFDIDKQCIALPNSMRQIYLAEFARIYGLLESQQSAFEFDWSNDLFAKDMAICTGRGLPIGPGFIQVGRIPRSLLLRGGLKQMLTLLHLFVKFRGVSPVLCTHVHMANIEQFNPEGWEKAYALIAEILELNPDIKGVMRGSWYFDPKIETISPHLAYLRTIPQQYGAKLLYMCDEGRESSAFTRSKSRLKLFENGDYVPKVYYLIWARDHLLQYLTGASKNP